MKNRVLFHLIVLCNTICVAEKLENISPNQLRFREIVATRTNIPPIIDGIINDEVWEDAIIENEFVQFEPYNLAAPSEKTEVRLMYDNDYVYIAVNNYDTEPEKITGRLSRKDRWMEAFGPHSDWLGIGFDSNNDDRTGYWFAVNPAESRMDVYVSDATNVMEAFDSSWDVVWEFKTAIHDQGWSIEMKIPMSVFQFKANKNEDWGLQVARYIHRLQEEVQWPGRSKGVNGFVPYYGILKGMDNIPSPKKVEILPYVLSGNNDKSYVSSLGLDVKYGMSAQSSLNLTINPDFGQVEADPSVLNLTVFETQFEEKRPFFIEGGSFFKNRYKLFHSRRIGQTPGILVPEGGVFIDRPDATTILGAGKILGETTSGTKYGIIEAVTDVEFGIWESESGDTVSGRIEPKTNYFIGRVEQSIFNNLSTIGVMMTDLRRVEAGYSNVIGLDWRLKFIDNALTLKGQIVHSTKDGISGNGARFNFGYLDPKWWDLNFVIGFTNDKYEINDLGFNERNDKWYYGSYGGFRKQDPWGKFLGNILEYRFFINGRGEDGLTLSRSLSIEQRNELKNYWSFGAELNMQFAAYNDEDTFRDERAWVYQSETEGYGIFWFQTDKRKKLILRPYLGYRRGEHRPWGYRAGLRLRYRPLNNINLMIEGFQDLGTKSMEWVDIEEDSIGTNIIYAESVALMNDIQIRFNWTFTPDLTFEAFFQPFTVDLDYKTFYKLMAEKTRNLEPYDYIGNPDFKIKNVVGTFVVRWEYRPGSTLFFVYNLHNDNYYNANDDNWDKNSANSLFVKFNYWLQI
ncbi:MAG TPA: DUF5916 domain-containing protein [Candidatus Marinimicrobia bacterium]|jgi:hypothetical protein|nr:DUF5916 domain-containing protein [Candidatus Neomarinimicrobiota bacterium]|tara:strand:+ start:211 stop:2601 length:2391 start_codon:yes stop_codon:yes gene_type:complete